MNRKHLTTLAPLLLSLVAGCTALDDRDDACATDDDCASGTCVVGQCADLDAGGGDVGITDAGDTASDATELDPDAVTPGRRAPVRIEAGRAFTMGASEGDPCASDYDEQPITVTLTRDFWIDVTEVTQEEWRDLGMDEGGMPVGTLPLGDGYPMIGINFYEALELANRRSARLGLTPCYDLSQCTGTPGSSDADARFACDAVTLVSADDTPYGCEGWRLPTEAEWEYAARNAGQSDTATFRGDPTEETCGDIATWLDEYAWNADNGSAEIQQVAELRPSPNGLFDIYGNAAEMVFDGRGRYPGSGTTYTNPVGDLGNTGNHVVRGGDVDSMSAVRNFRASSRASNLRNQAISTFGFRLVRTVPAE